MAINFTKDYNREIRRVVKNFNARRKTLSKKGIKLTPAPVKVSDLKARYETRSDLNKELALLNKVSSSSDSLIKQVENAGGATAVQWELDYLKLNEKAAIEYFKREYDLVSKKVGRFPGERTRLDSIAANLEVLNLDLDYMNQEQFKSYRAAIRSYMTIPGKMKGGYRGFLTQIDEAMGQLGYSEEDKRKVFNKLKVLKPHQFHAMYEESDMIDRLYEISGSPKHGSEKGLTTTPKEAKKMIEEFLEEEDELIAKYLQY